ncbi:MAG: hypothetical protein ACI9R3_003334 [Verrucomicrobiales bacterium]|jgi:uncharacterized protein (TIGR02598 family)
MIRTAKSSVLAAAGFTLVEVVIAIGIVSGVMIPMVILLGYGVDNAGDITARDRALRLVPAIEQRLNSADYAEARGWGQSGGSLYAYVYRAVPATAKADGDAGSATTGNDVFIAVARSTTESGAITTEIASLEGQMFRIDLKPAQLSAGQTGNSAAASMPSVGSAAASVELEADILRVLSPPRWQSSEVEHRVTLHFVINR